MRLHFFFVLSSLIINFLVEAVIQVLRPCLLSDLAARLVLIIALHDLLLPLADLARLGLHTAEQCSDLFLVGVFSAKIGEHLLYLAESVLLALIVDVFGPARPYRTPLFLLEAGLMSFLRLYREVLGAQQGFLVHLVHF